MVKCLGADCFIPGKGAAGYGATGAGIKRPALLEEVLFNVLNETGFG